MFRKVLGHIKEFILGIATCVNHTYDLETQGHVMVYVTFVVSGCVCPTAMNVFCFVRFSDQGIHSNYCHMRDHHV